MNFEKALSNLKDLCLCLDNNQIEYWLCCGTLLGVIRDNSLIKHDNDVDICINIDHLDYNLIQSIQVFGFSIKSGYGLIKDGFELCLERFGEKIDIFFFYKNDNYWYHSVYTKIDKNYFGKFDYVFSPFSLTRIEFDNYHYSIPNNPEIVLEQQYGINWRKPDKNWLYYKSPKNIVDNGQKILRSESRRDLISILSNSYRM